MKNTIFALMLLILSFVTAYGSYFYFDNIHRLFGIFLAGVLFGVSLMIIKLNVKNDRLKTYKRELEKESISSDESSAKVKVLESKIEVLEKALENALKK